MARLSSWLKTRLDWLWRIEATTLPWYQRVPVVAIRVGYAVGRDALQGELTLQAMGLVYTTLLALVPLIALSFSLLKGFGMHNVIEPALYQFLSPLGARGHTLAGQITDFVGNVNASVLGSVGVVFLFFTVVSMLQKVEGAFNRIWQVHRGRILLRRFTDYLAVVIIGPVLLVGALGLTAAMSHLSALDHATGGALTSFMSRTAPYVLAIAAFAFVYMFVPNTRVRWQPALIGAVLAGVCWQTAGLAFTLFTASTTRVTAIYSGFAIIIFFLMWLYLSWLILLSGAKIAFYIQNPAFVSRYRIHRYLGSRLREKLALLVMLEVGRCFVHGRTPPSVNALTQQIQMPGEVVANICNQLKQAGYLQHTDTPDNGLVPGRDLSALSLGDIVLVARYYDAGNGAREIALAAPEALERRVQTVDVAIADALSTTSVLALVHEADAG